ncbi:MAG: transcription termination/antitermination NusG family protein [Methylocystis sp.]|jgi:transcriptional antiterminator RfaH
MYEEQRSAVEQKCIPILPTPKATNAILKPGQRWYLAHTLPHKESIAGRHLDRQGFRNFTPRRVKTVRHARKLRMVNAPLFPSYVFVALDLDVDRWHSVNGTIGITRLIMAQERPLALPAGVVETLIMSSDQNGRLRFIPDIARGETVRLIAGPFAEALGVLDSLDDRGRVEVLLNIMGGDIRVKMHRDWIEPAA